MANEHLLKWRIGTGVTLSVGLHLVALAVVAMAPPPRLEPPETVSFAVVQEEVEPPEPEPLVEPEPEPPEPPPEPPPKPIKPRPKPRPKPKEAVPEPPAEEPPPPSEEPPAPARESPADFTGMTLTNDGPGEGWVTAVGSGAPMDAPIGTPGAVTGRKRKGVAGGAIGGSGTRVARLSDLSRKPVAPDRRKLDAALTRNYPKQARQRGIEGETKLTVRVLSSGKLRPLKTVSESYPGFARACRATLREVRFSPGLDAHGDPVATDIPFTCSFTIY